MAEMSVKNKSRRFFRFRHRGRVAQVGIYLGKLIRMFVYQNDWKVLPMAALIGGLVGMVIRRRLFITMEGTLLGGFAMVMVCIWNGCFNSIQVICRERDVIKREHRSGMHISSYICAHMIYQALLCILQTAVTLYVTKTVGVKYPAEGLFTPWMIVDFGISMFLITYASDMMSLWISTLAHNTTTAMTIMPFVLIFQLVFSGGMLSLPQWTSYITPFTISNPAVKVIAAQGGYNSRPVLTIWDQVNKMRDKEVSATVNVGQVLDLLQNEDIEVIRNMRQMPLARVFTLGEVKDLLDQSSSYREFRQENLLNNMTLRDLLRFTLDNSAFDALWSFDFKLEIPGLSLRSLVERLLKEERLKPVLDRQVTSTTTVGDVLDAVDAEGLLEKYRDMELGKDISLGKVVDMLAGNSDIQSMRDKSYTYTATLGSIIEMIGEERVKDILQNKVGEASYKPEYANTPENILEYWISLAGFILAFAALAVITLEFIDKDKR